LASNSLLEALVFGRRAAEDINHCFNEATVSGKMPIHDIEGAPMPTGMRTTIRNIMQKSHFVLPNPDQAAKYRPQVDDITTRLLGRKFRITNDYLEARSLATVASIILKEVSEK
jgi:L-aspartate oxidase